GERGQALEGGLGDLEGDAAAALADEREDLAADLGDARAPLLVESDGGERCDEPVEAAPGKDAHRVILDLVLANEDARAAGAAEPGDESAGKAENEPAGKAENESNGVVEQRAEEAGAEEGPGVGEALRMQRQPGLAKRG